MKNNSSSNKSWWGKSTAVLVIMVLLLVASPVTAAFALDTGFLSPTRAQTNGKGWKNITNVFVLDGKYSTAIKANKTLRLSRFGIPAIPGGSTITGIEVKVVGHTAGYQANVSLSYNNGGNYVTPIATTLTASDTTNTLGGSSNTWGRTWTPADFTNTNFILRLALTGTPGTLSVDQVQVKVYYTLPTTTLTLNPVSGSYGGTANMGATLTQTAGGTPIVGATITFYLGGNGLDSGGNCTGTLAGTGTTIAGGVATLTGASLTGIAAGDYPYGACASYAGGGGLAATAITSDLNVNGVSSALVVADATGAYGGTIDLSATLTINGAPASSKNVDFYLFGNFEGTAVTDGSGVASLTGVSLAGFDAGTSQDIEAIFASADPSVNPSDVFGQITITQQPLTVTAVTDSKVYDGTTSSSGTPLITGTILAGDTNQFFQTFDTKDPGTGKTISIGGAVDDGNSGLNYNVTPVSSTGTITKASLIVSADDLIKVYGQPDPIFTFHYTGLQNGEDGSALNTPPTCTVSVPHTALGNYPIVCSGGADIDYNFSYVGGTLSVDAEVKATISGVLQGTYDIGKGDFTRQNYPSLNNGPLQVKSGSSIPFVASERVIYTVPTVHGGAPLSYSELIGFPANKLTTDYWIPWYNDHNFWTQLRIGNPSPTLSTTVQVWIGSTLLDTIPLGPNESVRKDYPEVNGGPVHIVSTNSSAPIIAAERFIYPEGNGMVIRGTDTSYFELMAIPGNQLTTQYWIPWYNNVNFWTQLRFANVSPTLSTTVQVYMGTTLLGSFPLGPASSTRQDFPGVNGGPIRIVSTNSSVPIIAAERVIYDVGGTANRGTDASYSEMAAIPDNQLTSEYWFPSYSYPDASTWSQIRVANPSATTPATIDVYLGKNLLEEFSLPAATGVRKDYLGQDGGPMRIVSKTGLPILAAQRVILSVSGVQTSYAEVMGFPGNQITDTYVFPWYNNFNFDTQLRISLPNVP